MTTVSEERFILERNRQLLESLGVEVFFVDLRSVQYRHTVVGGDTVLEYDAATKNFTRDGLGDIITAHYTVRIPYAFMNLTVDPGSGR